jgi:orotidine-5'-phosphate decarboxylase
MNPLIVALDTSTVDEARGIAARLGDAAGHVKIGLDLLWAVGQDAARGYELPVMLDAKLHDIPTTVARAVRALRPLEASLLTVHALGGRAMLEAANEEKGSTRTLAVSILTSLDDMALKEMGLPPAAEAVPALARLAADSGCDGVVCAPTDLRAVRAECPAPFLLVTPGVRPPGAPRDDQARTLAPKDAMEAGADYLVVGRPVTRAPDPRAAALAIVESL